MTDNEIIKALKCCIDVCDGKSCHLCSLYDDAHCQDVLLIKSIDLIKRQQAEIEELGYKLGALLCYVTNGKLSKSTYPLATMKTAVDDAITDDCNDAKSEAVKEFVERLKKKARVPKELLGVSENKKIHEKDIDEVLKEMVGE